MHIDLDRLRIDLTARAEHVAREVLGEPNHKLSSKRSLRFGNKGSLEVVVAGKKAGLWYDHENRIGGDLIDLIQRERRCGFRQAGEIAGVLLSTAYVVAPIENRWPPAGGDNRNKKERTRDALRLFREASSIIGTIGEHYLARRG